MNTKSQLDETIRLHDIKACLFDLDGVLFDTEPQYTIYWGSESRRYHPEIPDLEHIMKGQTLGTILSQYFGDVANEHEELVARLDAYEQQMSYDYVAGAQEFVKLLKASGIKTAVVTSSNDKKMAAVYRQHPDFCQLFDTILTADDIHEGKPSPECYLTAAKRLNVEPCQCIVFEDSINGLKSGQSANMFVVGLTTTNPEDKISPLSDIVIQDFT